MNYHSFAFLRHIIRLRFAQFEQSLQTLGIEPQHHSVLAYLKSSFTMSLPISAVSIGAIAHHLQIRHHSAVELIDRMANLNLVERKKDDDDSRMVLVKLKPRGNSLLKKSEPAMKTLYRELKIFHTNASKKLRA